MNLKINKQNEQLVITRNDGVIIYQIRNEELKEVIIVNGKSISKWIRQLLEKNWVNNELLYNVAFLIKELELDFQIDWINTFYIVEKKEYIDQSFELKSLIENGVDHSMKIDFIKKVEFANSKVLQNIDDTIFNIVNKKLKHYQIIE